MALAFSMQAEISTTIMKKKSFKAKLIVLKVE